MADIESNIRIDIDTTDALSAIKNLQRQISAFHSTMQQSGNAANAAISDGMQRNLVNSINATKKFSASMVDVKGSTESFTTALEKNKLSLGQYFRYAGASTKTFGRLFTNEFNTIEKVARERVKTLQTQYIKMGRDANGAIQAIKVRPLALDMEKLGTQVQIAAQKQQIFNQLLKQGSTNLLNFGKNTQWAGRQLMVGFTVPLSMMGVAAVKSFMEMEKAVLKFQRVYGDLGTTAGDTEKMIKQIEKLANSFTKYGVAVADTMSLAADAAAMGKTGADLSAQVSEATRLAILGGVEQAQALETTTSLTNAFGVATEDLANKINFLNSVENQTVTSIEDLTIAIPKAGPVVQQLGGDVEDLAFFLTAMKEGGINASEGANALKSGLASLINPTGKASEFLQTFGINVKNIVDSNKGDVKGLVLDFASALDTLDPLNRARAIEQMFGKFQFARMSTLFQNVIAEGSQASRVLDMTKASAQELAILSEREMKKVENSPMFKFQKALEDIKASLIPLGEEFLKLITPLVEFGVDMLKQFNNLDAGVKQFVMGAVGVLGLIAPAAIMTFGLFANGIANIIKGVSSVSKMFYKLAGATSDAAGPMGYFTQEQLEASAVAASLEQVHSNLTQQFTSETFAILGLKDAYHQAIIAINEYSAASSLARAAATPTPSVAPPISKVPGSRRAQSPGGSLPGYASGIISVPGPKGAGDVVPSLLSPGEAVIPADVAKKNRGFIAAMIAGKIPGFNGGKVGFDGMGDTEKYKAQEYIDSISAALPNGVEIVTKALDRAREDLKLTSAGLLREMSVVAEQFGVGSSELLKAAGWTNDQIGKKRGSQQTENIQEQWARERGSVGEIEARRASEASATGRDAIRDFHMSNGMTEEEALKKANAQTHNAGSVRSHIVDVGPNAKFAANKEAFSTSVTTAQSDLANNFLTNLIDRPTGKKRGSFDAMQEAIRSPEAGIDPAMQDAILEKIETDIALTEQELIEQGKAIDLILTKRRDLIAQGGAAFESQLVGMSAEAKYYGSQERIAGVGDRTPQELAAGKAAINKVMYRGNQQYAETENLPRIGAKLADPTDPKDVALMKQNGVDLVKGMDLGIREEGELASPSKKMFRSGADLVRGLVNGVKEGYDEANQVGDQLGDAIINGARPDGLPPTLPSIPGFPTTPTPSFTPPASDAASVGKNIGKKLFKGIDDKLSDLFTTGALSNTALGQAFKNNAISNALESGGYKNGVILTDSKGNEADRANVNPAVGAGSAAMMAASINNGNDNQLAFDADGNPIVDNKGRQLTQQQQEKSLKKQASAQKRGRMAGKAMGALGTLTMVSGMASGMGGPIGDIASAATPFLGALSAIVPLLMALPLPIAAVVAGLGLIAFGLYKLNEGLMKAREEATKMAKTFSSGREAMDGLAEFAGTVNPSEAMDRIRAERRVPYQIVTGKNTFGAEYLESEAGKNLIDQARTAKQNDGGAAASKALAIQLSQAIASNVLTKNQAASIASNVGEALGDYDFAIDVNATMVELIGPGGEDLTKDPLEIQARIIEAKQETLTQTGGAKELIDATNKDMGIDGRQNYTEVAAAEAQVSKAIQDIADMGQQNLDTLELEHLKRLEVLEAAGDLAGIEKENKKFNQDKLDVLNTTSAALKEEAAYLDKLEGQGGARRKSAEQIVDNMENSFEALFASADEATKKMATRVVENISDQANFSFSAKAAILATMTVDNVDLFDRVQTLFDPDNAKNDVVWNGIANMSLEFGKGMTEDMLAILPGFSDVNKAGNFIDYVLRLKTEGGPESSDAALQTMTALSKLKTFDKDGKEKPISLDQYVDKDGKVTEKFKTLTKNIKEMNTLFSKNKGKKITYEMMSKVTGLDLSKEAQAYFNSLPADQQKIYTETYLTVLDTIDLSTDEGKARVKKYRADANLIGGTVANYTAGLTDLEVAQSIASGDAYQKTEESKGITTVEEEEEEEEDSGGTKTDPYENLLSRLKRVRDAAINAAGGISELNKALAKGSTIAKGLFRGVSQQLTMAGYSAEFIDDMMALDEEQRKKFMTVDKKGKVTVTKDGKAYQEGLREAAIGEYQDSVVRSTADLGYQSEAFDKLVKNGMSTADAMEVASDANMAYAIATNASTTEIKDMVKWLEKQAKAQRELDFKTAAGREKIVSGATSKVSEYFAAQEAKVNKDFESGANTSGRNTSGFNIGKTRSEIEKAQDEIADYQYEIDDIQYQLDGIAKAEDEINKRYEERVEALENIWEANSDIMEQQKGQLSIAQALTSGDVAAAAKAMQEEQARAADRAREEQKAALEKSKELELASVRSTNGKTRVELEKSLLTLQEKIAKIEEERVEPAEKIVKAAERAKALAIEAVGEAGYLGQTKKAWENVADAARNATVESEEFAKSIQEALKAIPGFTEVLDANGKFMSFKFDPKAYSAWLGTPAEGSGSGAASNTVVDKEALAAINTKIANAERYKANMEKLGRSAEAAGAQAKLTAYYAERKRIQGLSKGGMVVPKYFASGGFAMGTDTVPAMLTPGEFVMSNYAVKTHGIDKMRAINSGRTVGDSVYNSYELNVNVKSDANADEIARAVMTQIRQVNSQQVRGNRF
jgi:TP901 family phage tail tape measure protein